MQLVSAIRWCMQAYTVLRESPGIIAAELAGVSGAGFQGSENRGNAEFRVRANVTAREASAILCIEDNATLGDVYQAAPSMATSTGRCRVQAQGALQLLACEIGLDKEHRIQK